LLARVFFCFNKAQSCLAETILLANEERNFPEQPFHKTVIKRQVFFTKIVLRKMVKTRKAADRDFSGALFSQNFPYSTKNSREAFPSSWSNCAAVFTLEIIILWAARISSKQSLNTKFFSV
tara:strand:- start:46 stop:408 length:363 start_codon:yes stop_codon:yes gene_type:complete